MEDDPFTSHLRILDDLTESELNRFKGYLSKDTLEGFVRIPKGKLEKEEVCGIVTLMNERYGTWERCKEMTLHILKALERQDLIKRFGQNSQDSSTGSTNQTMRTELNRTIPSEMAESSIFTLDGGLQDDERNITNMQNSVDELKDHKLYSIFGNSPDVEPENLKILRAEFDSSVEQVKARDNVKNSREVQHEEFSKETLGFSFPTIEKLMDLRASVCQVRYNDEPIGTGCLLFERCILTNGHVITDAQGQLLGKLSVSFDFENLKTGSKQFAIKKKPLAYEYKYTPQHTMDFAVLELKTSAEALPPPLLKHYSAAPVRGGVCIIGHPAGGVKRMDMSLIIERSKQEGTVRKHISDHPECVQVIGEAYFKARQGLDDNQIEYHTGFFHGSSGSPLFDEFGNVIGIHTGGYGYKNGEGSFDSIIEYAQPLLPILVSILRQTKDKRSDVWESFRAEKNTKQVVKLVDDKTFKPESTNSCLLDLLSSDEEDMDCDH